MLEDRDVLIGVFPEGEEILVGSLCLGLISRQGERSAQLQARQRVYGVADNDPAVIENFLEFRGGFVPRQQCGATFGRVLDLALSGASGGFSGDQVVFTTDFADGSQGGLGFISSVSQAFYTTCNRVRLTAEGGLRTCLFSLQETPLRDLLRSGASDDHLGRVIEAAVWHKEEGHLINKPGFIKPAKNMSQIGG